VAHGAELREPRVVADGDVGVEDAAVVVAGLGLAAAVGDEGGQEVGDLVVGEREDGLVGGPQGDAGGGGSVLLVAHGDGELDLLPGAGLGGGGDGDLEAAVVEVLADDGAGVFDLGAPLVGPGGLDHAGLEVDGGGPGVVDGEGEDVLPVGEDDRVGLADAAAGDDEVAVGAGQGPRTATSTVSPGCTSRLSVRTSRRSIGALRQL
jgi:hypothetical protein